MGNTSIKIFFIKSWIEFNFCCAVEIVYLLLLSKRVIDWLSRQLPPRDKRLRVLYARAIRGTMEGIGNNMERLIREGGGTES